VLYVPELKKNLLSVSVLEDRGFVAMFKKGKVLIRLEEASPDTTMSIGVREGELYRLQGKLVCRSKGIGSYPFTCEWIDVSGRGRGAKGSKGRSLFRDFQFRESTFRWGGGVSPFQLCQKTQLV
jgi:hypothetical protein